MNKSLYDISWQVDEPTYREDSALSYSTLAAFNRGGFNELDHLFDRKETPSLTFGSAVDSIITGGQQEFDSRFLVADFPDISDTIVKVVKAIFEENHITYSSLEDVPANNVLFKVEEFGYQNNWKPETRVKVIKEKGSVYYSLLYLSENKTLITSETHQQILAAVRALKEQEPTSWYFQEDDPFNDRFKRYYQLKFKATLNGIGYRCMADLIVVDYEKKTIQPVDLKTSSHKEWDFFKSFVQWDYQIQARLYYRIIKDNCERDEFFKDFTVLPYKFIVVNKETLTPLIWDCPFTTEVGTLTFGKNNTIEFKDPFQIGKELNYYLGTQSKVPVGIYKDESNNLVTWLNTL